MKRFLAILSILILTACVNEQYLSDPQAAFDSVECDADDFRGTLTCTMPEKTTCSKDGSDSVMSCSGNRSYAKLRVVDTGQFALFAITGHVFNLGWTFPHSATDISGRDLEFNKTDTKVGYCPAAAGVCQTFEYFAIYLDRNYIKSHLYNGITIKIYGQRGNSLITLPPAYVQGFDMFLRSQGI